MKKTICVLLTVVLILGTAEISVSALTEVKYGNVNGDTSVGADDARLVLRKAVGLEDFDIYESKAADLDFDGMITAADARLCLRMSVGLDTPKPVSDVNILLHGKSYYVSCKMINESGSTPFIFAKDGSSFIFSIPFDSYCLSYLKNDSGRYIAYNKNYVPLTASVMKLLGIDSVIASLDSVLGVNSSIFAGMLKGYEESKTLIEVDAKMVPRNKTVILGTAGAYTVVYETIDGQLMSIESFTSRGTSTNRVEFDVTTSFIPDGLMDTSSFSRGELLDIMLNISNNKTFLEILDKLSNS